MLDNDRAAMLDLDMRRIPEQRVIRLQDACIRAVPERVLLVDRNLPGHTLDAVQVPAARQPCLLVQLLAIAEEAA